MPKYYAYKPRPDLSEPTGTSDRFLMKNLKTDQGAIKKAIERFGPIVKVIRYTNIYDESTYQQIYPPPIVSPSPSFKLHPLIRPLPPDRLKWEAALGRIIQDAWEIDHSDLDGILMVPKNLEIMETAWNQKWSPQKTAEKLME